VLGVGSGVRVGMGGGRHGGRRGVVAIDKWEGDNGIGPRGGGGYGRFYIGDRISKCDDVK
jgi:hypothetical protein